MPRHFQVHKLLDRAELDALEAFAREPGRTVDECHEWMQAKGYTLSRSAVGAWKEEFSLNDKVRRAAEVSTAYLSVGKSAGATDIAAASLMRFQQMLFEHLLAAEDADAGELLKLSISLKTAVQAGQHLEELKEQFEARQKQAIREAEKTASAGGNAQAVVSKVREILGIS